MNFQYRADFWPEKITQKVRIVRTMIKNTRSENKAEELIATRDGLTMALKQAYDLESPPTVIAWTRRVQWQLKRAVLDLEFVIKTTNRRLPVTTNVYLHAGNLVKELENIIGKIEIQPTRKG